MKVVWVAHSGDLGGGAERVMLAAIEVLRARGVEVAVIAPENGELTQALQDVKVHIVPYTVWAQIGERVLSHRLKRALRNLVYTPAVVGIIRKEKPDVVVTNTLSIPIGAVAARLALVPHVWFTHEMYGADGHGWRFDLGERFSFALMNRFSRLVLANSAAAVESYAQFLPRRKLRQMHYSVDVRPRPTNEGIGTLRLIQVARLSPGKRAEDAIRAIALLPNVHLTLLGTEEPAYGAFLHKLVDELNVQSRVRFIPFTDDPSEHVAAADVALMCSRGESFGLATIEAMKLGKPVVGADSGGTAELIRDGETGLLFRTGDAEDLAKKLERLYEDRALIRTLGANARKWAHETFNRERYAAELLEVFEEVRR